MIIKEREFHVMDSSKNRIGLYGLSKIDYRNKQYIYHLIPFNYLMRLLYSTRENWFKLAGWFIDHGKLEHEEFSTISPWWIFKIKL